jgi:DNA-directed RNA polymerase specialized sigma24 family protein
MDDWKKNERLLKSLSNKFSYMYGLDASDLFGVFQLEYLRIKDKFSSEKGSLSNFLYTCCKNKVIDIYKARSNMKTEEFNDEIFKSKMSEYEQKTTDFYIMLNSMSVETRELFNLLQNDDFTNAKKTTHNKHISINDIVKYLKKENWKWSKITNAINELKSLYLECYEN